MSVLDQIVKAYDIRGTVPDQLDADVAHALGVGFASFVNADSVVVARDMRPSGPKLVDAFSRGLMEHGVDVIDIGLASTDLMYFASGTLDVPGAMFTASHNPAGYNGVKLCLAGARPVGLDSGLAEVRDVAERVLDGHAPREAASAGSLTERDLLSAFADHVLTFVDPAAIGSMRVVADTANGMGGLVVPAVFERLDGVELEVMYPELDGTFPNHHPDPTVAENLVDLIRTVREGGFEVGIGFDGDGDRIGVVDGLGRIIWGDQILQILAEDVLQRRPGATIIADVKASRALFEQIAAAGGKPMMWKTGHSLIKAKMAETEAPLAGEMSGHIFYKDGFYGHDDALYVAVRLLDILARSDRTLAARKDAMPHLFNTPELRFDCREDQKFAVIETVKAHLAAAGAEVDGTDGVRVTQGDGWWLLRASNTQAVLVGRAEALSPEGLDACKTALTLALAEAGLEVHIPA